MAAPQERLPAAIECDRSGSQVVYRLRAGMKGTGRQLAVIRDRGYGAPTCWRRLAEEAMRLGYQILGVTQRRGE